MRRSINRDVIRSRDNPLAKSGGLTVLRGNLAPDGAVIKPTAAEARLMKHTGRAVVFKDYDDMNARIDDDSSTSMNHACWCCRTRGPLGGAGMPEWGQLPIPKKLLRKGVRDMVRISDSRMSGTCVWRVRAARRARSLHRRAARVGARRRSDRARRRRAKACICKSATPS